MTARYLLPFGLLAAAPCPAGEAVLQWNDPSHYTDIAPGPGTAKATLAGMQRAFTGAFEQSASALPEGYMFRAEIINVDLAGQVNPPQAMNPNLMNTRVLTRNYFPSIILSFELKGPGGQILASGDDVLITDMDYLSRSTSANASMPFYYEDRMIRNWFVRTVSPAVK